MSLFETALFYSSSSFRENRLPKWIEQNPSGRNVPPNTLVEKRKEYTFDSVTSVCRVSSRYNLCSPFHKTWMFTRRLSTSIHCCKKKCVRFVWAVLRANKPNEPFTTTLIYWCVLRERAVALCMPVGFVWCWITYGWVRMVHKRITGHNNERTWCFQ